ncbi:PHB depolymerase family esterase [Micromonospora sp. CV4]|uniref:extracellular catalytic domain type 1 short-chain-length polyhydroxyalkanoate depolymerase n=1 Tax=Micromonospora sp. CV4 TaxID=2478711 RepID=UPI000EF4F203|nr:PHB depolymerase family esterase [Micromonospora sp. CV4]RLP93049.1 esterase [Micromonospora sp. CV4]
MTLKTRVAGAVLAMVTLAAAALTFAAPASAATLTQVTGFGNNPTNLQMHLYVPDRVAARPAVLLALHYCTGSGPAYHSGTQYASLADRYGFIVIYPSVTRSSLCWDVSSPQALRRGGGSDPVGLMSMVDYVRQRYSADPARIFATGTSSGAMMTNVMLGDYPDVFAAGASFAGVPFGCFATGGGSEWNSECANGQLIRTPQQWGDLVREAHPGYTGRRPRMQIWHGTNDETLRYPNFGEQVKQWTNVHGLSQTPTYTDTPQSGYTRTRYGSSGPTAPVEAISMQGVSHNLPVDAAQVIRFFGLDGATPPPTNGGCRVGYAVNAWNTGLTASVTITNTGATAVNGWTLTFTLPAGQRITSGWNAQYATTSGAVTARNVSYNAAIAPNASVSIGFQATHEGGTGAPSSFALNGIACSVA